MTIAVRLAFDCRRFRNAKGLVGVVVFRSCPLVASMPSVHKQGTESFPKMAAAHFGLQGFLSATVSQVANLFVPYRTATRQFHSSCTLWEELPRKPRYVEPIYEHVQRRPLIKRNPTKIVAIIWIILAPIAIGAFFLTKEYIEKKRLRVMKRQREMNLSSQRN